MCQGRYSTFDIRVRAVEAVERGMAVGQVAEAFNIDRSTLFRWVRNYQADGHDGLERQAGSGRPRLLEDLAEGDLRQMFCFLLPTLATKLTCGPLAVCSKCLRTFVRLSFPRTRFGGDCGMPA